MRVLAIIPARAGSKRVPGKNKRAFCGKPLIHWTIESALEVETITKVVITTDDEEILDYSDQFSSVDFYKRPTDLAGDLSTSVDVTLDVMARYKNFDCVVLLQPTSPLRTSFSVRSALGLFKEMNAEQLVSVRRSREVPGHLVVQKGGFIRPLMGYEALANRSQDWGEVFALNGAIYISKWSYFLEHKKFMGENTVSFLMSDFESIDIDTEEDWRVAESAALKGSV